MNVLLFTSTFPRWENDNVPQFTFELAKNLARLGLNVHVLAPHYQNAKTYECTEGITIHRFRYAPEMCEKLAYGGGMLPNIKKNPFLLLTVPLYIMLSAFSIYRLHKKIRFSVLNPHWHFMQGWITGVTRVFIQNKPRVLCTVHGSDAKIITTWPFNYISKLIDKEVTCFSFVSNHLADIYHKKNLINKNFVIRSMGINDAFFTPITACSVEKKGQLVFVGRLNKNKGVNILLEAISKIGEKSFVKLDIFGDGPDLESLRRTAVQFNVQHQVNFRGWIDNEKLAKKLEKYEVAIFPSLVEEGFGLTSLEALLRGCKVLLPKFSSAQKNFTKYTGVKFFEPSCSDQLAMMLLEALNNNIESEDYNSIREEFSWLTVAADYKKHMETLWN